MEENKRIPQPGDVWQHHKGPCYTVIDVTDEPDPEKADKFPRTVFYRGPDGRKWPRKLSSWLEKFTFLYAAADQVNHRLFEGTVLKENQCIVGSIKRSGLVVNQVLFNIGLRADGVNDDPIQLNCVKVCMKFDQWSLERSPVNFTLELVEENTGDVISNLVWVLHRNVELSGDNRIFIDHPVDKTLHSLHQYRLSVTSGLGIGDDSAEVLNSNGIEVECLITTS